MFVSEKVYMWEVTKHIRCYNHLSSGEEWLKYTEEGNLLTIQRETNLHFRIVLDLKNLAQFDYCS